MRDTFPYLVEGDGTKGVSSPGVLAMKYLLHQVLYDRNKVTGSKRKPLSKLDGKWENGPNSATVSDLVVAKQWLNLRDIHGNINPHVFGLSAWRAFWKYATGKLGGKVNGLVQEELNRAAAAAKRRAEIAAAAAAKGNIRNVLREVGFRVVNTPGFIYAQIRPFPGISHGRQAIFNVANRRRYDCSSSFEGVYLAAGVEDDPSGYGWAGWGDTGSLWRHGERVNSPMVGDAVFYGWETQNARPRHVAMYVGDGKVFTFGSTPPKIASMYYRSDIMGYRSYID